jgi:hypothetical protein
MVSPDQADTLIPIAASIIGCVHDYDREDTGAVLNSEGIVDPKARALIVTLAAMVNPNATPGDLLAWTIAGPVKSSEYTPPGYDVKGLARAALGRRSERRAEVGRLTDLGLTAAEIGERLGITPRAVNRHRAAIRAALEMSA